MTSDSPDEPSRATRVRSGPAYQSRSVWVPETREVRSELPDPPADEPPPLEPEPEPPALVMAPRAGTPRSARCTTVPDKPSRRAFWTSTRSWAAVRGGRGESAWAEITPAAPAPPTTATTATPGTAHRRAGWVLKMLMATSCATWAESALRDPDPGSPAVAGWGRETAGGGGRGAAGPGAAPGADGRGFRRRRRPRRPVGAARRPARRLRRGGPGRHAARDVRLRRGADAADRGRLGPGPDAVGQGRRVRPGRRARLRRRRLPHQAVLLRRPARPAARPGAPPAARAPDGPQRRGGEPGPCHASGARGPGARGPHPPRVHRPGVLPAQPSPRGQQDRVARPRVGRGRGHRPQRGGGLHRLPAPQAGP